MSVRFIPRQPIRPRPGVLARLFRPIALLAVLLSLACLEAGAAERILLDQVRIAVNDKVLTHREVEEFRSLQARELKSRYSGDKLEQELIAMEKQIIEQLIEDLLVEAHAETLNIEVSDSVLDERVENILRRDPGMESVYTEEQMKNFVLKDMLRRRVLESEVDSKIYVSPQQISRLCSEGGQDEKEVEVGHILVRGHSDKAFDKIKDIRSRLLKGADFEQVAQKESEDPSARSNKGRLGFISRGQFVKDFEDKAFSLSAGQLSEPVSTEFGFHLIKVFSERRKGRMNCEKLDEANKEALYGRVYQAEREKRLKAFLEGLRAKADVRVFNPGEKF
ncbi:MAG: peptidylprolyl isomerase [Deltaproteobacteria bacterium]|nr:peptidylprolyl isomerase [Deltaproteobacteria bacterium]